MSNNTKGHLLALFTMTVWGTTYISSKTLLGLGITPIGILLTRFILGYICLWIISPKLSMPKSYKLELFYFLSGAVIALYYIAENYALVYTSAANVGLIISISPIITVFMSQIFLKSETLTTKHFIGVLLGLLGVFLVIYNGSTNFSMNILGDFIAVLAAFIWSVYSTMLKKLSLLVEDNVFIMTRKLFMYALMIFIILFFTVKIDYNVKYFFNSEVLVSIIYLSLFASALCFVSWNKAVFIIGPIKSSMYIYIVPIISLISAFLFLKEEMTIYSILGCIIIISALYMVNNAKPKESR